MLEQIIHLLLQNVIIIFLSWRTLSPIPHTKKAATLDFSKITTLLLRMTGIEPARSPTRS